MSELITSANDPRLPEIIQKHWYHFFKLYSSGGHFQHYETPYYSRIEFEKAWQGWTGVHLSNIPENKTDQVITEVINRYKQVDKPFTWWVGPTCKPTNLGEHLVQHGLRYDSDTPYMAVNLIELADIDTPEELEVVKVEDSDTLLKWTEAGAKGFGVTQFTDYMFNVENHESLWKLPNRIRYVGLVEGVPVSSGTVLAEFGVACIFQVATVPEARGKGYGTAVTLAPLRDMLGQGVKVGVLHSSKMGYSVYEKIGFKKVGQHRVYKST